MSLWCNWCHQGYTHPSFAWILIEKDVHLKQNLISMYKQIALNGTKVVRVTKKVPFAIGSKRGHGAMAWFIFIARHWTSVSFFPSLPQLALLILLPFFLPLCCGISLTLHSLHWNAKFQQNFEVLLAWCSLSNLVILKLLIQSKSSSFFFHHNL